MGMKVAEGSIGGKKLFRLQKQVGISDVSETGVKTGVVLCLSKNAFKNTP
jgi:hypothetical protein